MKQRLSITDTCFIDNLPDKREVLCAFPCYDIICTIQEHDVMERESTMHRPYVNEPSADKILTVSQMPDRYGTNKNHSS